MIAKTALRRLYHFARGTARPRIAPLGAFPREPGTFVFRFETCMPKGLLDAGTHLHVAVGAHDMAGECIELRRLDFVRGGIDLVKTAYSIALGSGFDTVGLSLVDASGTSVAAYELTAQRARELLDEFGRLTCDAASDKRYAAVARSAVGAGAPPHPADMAVDVAIVADDTDPARLFDTFESLSAQDHRRWSALVVAPGDALEQAEAVVGLVDHPRITLAGRPQTHLAGALSQAIATSAGEGMLFLRQGDILAPEALSWFCAALADGSDLVYCDVDVLDHPQATPENPRFKPDFNLDLLYSQDYIGDALALSRKALAALGARPVTLDDAWSLELALKVAEADLSGEHIAHIPHIECHVRPRAEAAARAEQNLKALEEHFDRRGIAADVGPADVEGVYRTTFAPPAGNPLASIVIPSKDHVDYLEPCIESILDKAGCADFEVIVVENNSEDPETFAYYERIQRQDARVRVVDFADSGLDDGSFNYPRLINFGVKASRGELLLLLNNDTQAITPGFLPLLAGYLSRPEVGVVGALLHHADGLVQHAGMALLRSGHAGFMNQHLSAGMHHGYLNSLVSAAECSCVLGACQMMRRETFDAVGGYCEELAITGNDIDFCWKVRERGLAVVYTPHVEFFHKEFGSRRSDDADAAQEEQSARESALLVQHWPRYYREGDGFLNPNLDQDSIYYKLGL